MVDAPEVRAIVARAMPAWADASVARVPEGVSTFVYRLQKGQTTCYLRVLPEPESHFGPEALAHSLLRARGARVPEVLYWEERAPELGLSTMITAEIAGQALGYEDWPSTGDAILEAAGRDLALVNSLPVEGFGWIERSRPAGAPLAAEFATYREFVHRHVDEHIPVLVERGVVRPGELDRIFRRYDALLDAEPAVLAHGDFDPTHIFHHEGQYSGIIDFGEIRGSGRLYDLGHFSIESEPLLPALLRGYRQVAELPSDAEPRIRLSALLIALRRLGRRITRRPQGWGQDADAAAIRRNLSALLQ